MPSGAVTLLEASRYPSTMLAKGVVEVIVSESPLLEMLPQITLSGEAYVTRHEKELPSVAFRAVGGTYTRSYGTHTKHSWGVSILGGEVFVDNFIVRTRPDDATKARQFKAVAKAAALTFDRYALNGDGTGNAFKGFKTLIREGFGQSLLNASGGATIALAKLDEAIDLVRVGTPDALLMNRTVRRQITTLGRNVSGHALIDVGTSKFGEQVTMYNGIPIRILGDDETGAALLPFTEADDGTEGASDGCSSVYIAKFGDEENIFGIMGAGGSMEVVDFGEQEAAPGHMGRIEFYPGIVIASQYALVRLYAIDAA